MNTGWGSPLAGTLGQQQRQSHTHNPGRRETSGRAKVPSEWTRGLRTLQETGERAGWAAIALLRISPVSRSLRPKWGAARDGESWRPAVAYGAWGARRARATLGEARGLLSGLVFLGTAGDAERWPRLDRTVSSPSLLPERRSRRVHATARCAQDTSARCFGPPETPRDGAACLFLSPLSRFYRQLLVWDINCPGEFIDNFDVTEHRRNYPHGPNVKFEKNQVQRELRWVSTGRSTTMRLDCVCFPQYREWE